MILKITENFRKSILIDDNEENVDISHINYLPETKTTQSDGLQKDVEIVFTKSIIPTTNGELTNSIETSSTTVFENLNTNLVTFCSLNNSKHDFNPDECEQGDLIFEVNLKWLIDKINSDKRFFPFGTKPFVIDNLELLEKWNDIYTHEEGEYIYRDAIDENAIIGTPAIIGCNYCK